MDSERPLKEASTQSWAPAEPGQKTLYNWWNDKVGAPIVPGDPAETAH
jgi:hypothetical protein